MDITGTFCGLAGNKRYDALSPTRSLKFSWAMKTSESSSSTMYHVFASWTLKIPRKIKTFTSALI